jgi:hypothetical protein
MLHHNRPANLSILIPKRQWQTKYEKKEYVTSNEKRSRIS